MNPKDKKTHFTLWKKASIQVLMDSNCTQNHFPLAFIFRINFFGAGLYPIRSMRNFSSENDVLTIVFISMSVSLAEMVQCFSWRFFWCSNCGSLNYFSQNVWCILKLCHFIIYRFSKRGLVYFKMWIWVNQCVMVDAHSTGVERARKCGIELIWGCVGRRC